MATTEAGLALATMAVLAGMMSYYGMFHFGGMDGGVCAKGAWMCYLGYRPYVDFPAVCSPDYLCLGRLAFLLFGVRWVSFIYLGICVSSLLFLFHWLVLRGLPMSLSMRWLIAVSTQLCTLVPLGWLSYNQTASVVGSIFIAAVAGALLPRQSRRSLVYLTIATLLLLMVKPNIAGFLGAAGYGVLFLRRRSRGAAGLCLMAALALWGVLLWAQGIGPAELVRHYLSAKGRLGSKSMLWTCLYDSHQEEAVNVLPILALMGLICEVFLIGAVLRVPKGVLTSPLVALGICGMGAGLVALMSNNDMSLVEAPMVISGAALIACSVPGNVFAGLFSRGAFVALVLCLVLMADLFAVQVTINRYRISVIGPGAFFEGGPTCEFAEGSFFHGIHGGPRLLAVDNQIRAVLKVYGFVGRLDAPVFFGPRIEYGYPAYGIGPPKGLPLWWPGTGETPQAEIASYVRTFQQANFQMCVFLKDDFTYIPEGVLQYLGRSYRRCDTGKLTVFFRDGGQ
jgi:hypothetical protein